jgi:two-component system, cell cycle sensor histidine kinase and response regulator CckA
MAGEGNIRIACRNEVITEDIDGNSPKLTHGNYACLVIADDGKGMNEETNKRVFEPFFTTKAEGRGLGLAAAYGIVKNHDGWISVDSELSKGTVVKIYLPAIEAAVKEDAKSKPKAEPIKGLGNMLVIEDEELVMEATREMLERLGYRVLEAKTGKEAIDIVQTFDGDIDLAMLDILLPGMNGDSIYPLLMKARPNLKVIVFSGYSIDGPAQKILNAGAEDFIQKPFTIVDLSEKLKKILGGDQRFGKQTAPNG